MRACRLGLAALLWASACGGPLGPIAGGRLSGRAETAPVPDWSFARRSEPIEIEVRPEDPYSVVVHSYVVDGRLYVEAGENGWSRWRGFLVSDPNARVRLEGVVYPVRAVRVTDPREISRVLPEFYEKDRDEPSDACRRTWSVDACDFEGTFVRLESAPDP